MTTVFVGGNGVDPDTRGSEGHGELGDRAGAVTANAMSTPTGLPDVEGAEIVDDRPARRLGASRRSSATRARPAGEAGREPPIDGEIACGEPRPA